MDKAIIDMSQDTMFVLDQVQDFLNWLMEQSKSKKTNEKASDLLELIHIKKEIILNEKQQEELTIVASDRCKIAADFEKGAVKTKSEQYFIEAAEANREVFLKKEQLDKLREQEFNKIVDILQKRKQENDEEGGRHGTTSIEFRPAGNA